MAQQDKKDNTLLLLLLGGVGIWLYMYWKNNGYFPWQSAASTVPAPSTAATSAAASIPSVIPSGAPVTISTAQTVMPTSTPASQTVTPTTSETVPYVALPSSNGSTTFVPAQATGTVTVTKSIPTDQYGPAATVTGVMIRRNLRNIN